MNKISHNSLSALGAFLPTEWQRSNRQHPDFVTIAFRR